MIAFRRLLKRLMARGLSADRLLVRGRTGALQCVSCPVPISLTFDDGPDPQWTPPVLDALDDAGWTGTFFVIGRKAEAHPEVVHEIISRGHEVGNHTLAHCEPDDIGAQDFIDEVVRTRELLRDLTGRDINLMRPPKGRLNVAKMRALWRNGQSIILWNVDPRDYRFKDVESAAAWAAAYQPCDGDIVLLHDRLPFAAEIVRKLVEVRSDELCSVGISEWVSRPSRASGIDSRAKVEGAAAS